MFNKIITTISVLLMLSGILACGTSSQTITSTDQNISRGGVLSGDIAWQHDFDGRLLAIEMVDEIKTIFISTSSGLIAIDSSSGEGLWTTELSNSAFSSSNLEYADNTVVISKGNNGLIAAFDAQTGELLWEQAGPLGQVDLIQIHDGRVFVSRLNVVFKVYDLTTGELLWQGDDKGRISQGFIIDDETGRLFYEYNGQISELDPETGNVISSATLSENVSRFAFDGSNLYTVSGFIPTADLIRIDSNNEFADDHISEVASTYGVEYFLQLEDGLLIVLANDFLHVFGHETEQEIWRYRNNVEGQRLSRVAVTENHILVMSSSDLLAFDKFTGEIHGQVSITGDVEYAGKLGPILTDGLIVFPISSHGIGAIEYLPDTFPTQ